jgi:chaperonin GroES
MLAKKPKREVKSTMKRARSKTYRKAAKRPGRAVAARRKGIQPLADRVLLQRIDEDQLTRGGIIVPDTAKEKPQQGRVIEVGPGRLTEDGKHIPLGVHKGDKVLFGKYSGTEVTVGEDEYLILREDDILAIIG